MIGVGTTPEVAVGEGTGRVTVGATVGAGVDTEVCAAVGGAAVGAPDVGVDSSSPPQAVTKRIAMIARAPRIVILCRVMIFPFPFVRVFRSELSIAPLVAFSTI